MSRLLYAILPNCIIRAIRQRRDRSRRYKLAVREGFKAHDLVSK